MGFPRRIRIQALRLSRRHCCLCHKPKGRDIEIHHIQQRQPPLNVLANAIALCFDCHARVGHYAAGHPRGSKYAPAELRQYRDEWHSLAQQLSVPYMSIHRIGFWRPHASRRITIVAGGWSATAIKATRPGVSWGIMQATLLVKERLRNLYSQVVLLPKGNPPSDGPLFVIGGPSVSPAAKEIGKDLPVWFEHSPRESRRPSQRLGLRDRQRRTALRPTFDGDGHLTSDVAIFARLRRPSRFLIAGCFAEGTAACAAWLFATRALERLRGANIQVIVRVYLAPRSEAEVEPILAYAGAGQPLKNMGALGGRVTVHALG